MQKLCTIHVFIMQKLCRNCAEIVQKCRNYAEIMKNYAYYANYEHTLYYLCESIPCFSPLGNEAIVYVSNCACIYYQFALRCGENVSCFAFAQSVYDSALKTQMTICESFKGIIEKFNFCLLLLATTRHFTNINKKSARDN